MGTVFIVVLLRLTAMMAAMPQVWILLDVAFQKEVHNAWRQRPYWQPTQRPYNDAAQSPLGDGERFACGSYAGAQGLNDNV